MKRFTLTVAEKPVGPLLRQLAAQWKLELAVNESALTDAGISLDRRISFHVREATADQLLRAIADAAGLSVSRRGGWIEVGAARRWAWAAPALAGARTPAKRRLFHELVVFVNGRHVNIRVAEFHLALQFHICLVGKACIGDINAEDF